MQPQLTEQRTQALREAEQAKRRRGLAQYTRWFAPAFFGVLLLVFSVLSPAFATLYNFTNILAQTSILSIVGLGMTFVILGGSIDLSVGSVVGLASVVAVGNAHLGVLGMIIVGMAVGILCGLCNGIVFAKGKIPSFVATLGMMSVARGLVLMYTRGQVRLVDDAAVRSFGVETLCGVPKVFMCFVVLFGITYVLLNHTPFGRYIRALGGGERVLQFSGINVERLKVQMYALCGALAGIGGALLGIRMGAGTPTAGTGYELDVITSVVLGGTAMSGGVGNVTGTLLGAMIMGVLANGLNVMGVSAYYQRVISGVVLVVAVLVSMDRQRVGIIK